MQIKKITIGENATFTLQIIDDRNYFNSLGLSIRLIYYQSD